MKLLLDENLPHQLRHELWPHVCMTVSYLGWSGKSDAQLLALAAAQGFDAFLTKDAGPQYQQNISATPLRVVVLQSKTNDIDDLRPLIAALLQALPQLAPRSVTRIP